MRTRFIIVLAGLCFAVVLAVFLLADGEPENAAFPVGVDTLSCLRAASFDISVRRTRTDGTPIGVDALKRGEYVATIFFAESDEEAQRWANHLQVEESNSERAGLHVIHWGVVSSSRRSVVEQCLI